MVRDELIVFLKKEVNQIEGLVRQSDSAQSSKATILDILQSIGEKLDSRCLKLNEYDAITSTLIRNFDVLREFVIGDEHKFLMLESIIEHISKLRSSAKNNSA